MPLLPGRDTRPRVLVIGPLPPPPGGVGALVEAVLASPLAASWRLDVFNLSKPMQEGRPSTVTPWDVMWTLAHLVLLPWRLLTRRPRVALVQSTADTGYFRDLALILECRGFGVPVIVHWHGAPESAQFPGDAPWRRWLFGLGVALADRFIILADPYRPYFARFVPASKLVVVANFVDGDVFRSRDAAPASPALRVLFVGRVGPQKGTDVLLESLTRAREQAPELNAVLVGAGETAAQFAAAAAHPLVRDGVVRLTGPLGPERVDEYRRADVFVLPTRADSLPMAVLEAMGAGLPIVASGIGAIPWILDEGACGILVPPGDVGALARAFVDLAADAGLRSRLGAAARARQQEHFDARTAAAQLDRLFKATGGVN